jgi:hypothetical protein
MGSPQFCHKYQCFFRNNPSSHHTMRAHRLKSLNSRKDLLDEDFTSKYNGLPQNPDAFVMDLV